MGTGVMIGAGIFALTGQIAQLAGPLFPLAFIAGAIVTGFSAYSYIRMSNKWPSSGGIGLFGIAAIWSSGFRFAAASDPAQAYGVTGFIASMAFAILAFKGFTTITNSGSEITEPNRNVGRAIMLSIGICVAVYLLVAFGVGSSLTIDEIVAARDYSLAEAAEPALGQTGFLLTVILAAVATASGVLASVFAVSRMLAMLTDMKMIPHSHFGMSGPIQRHTLVYTVVIASTLAVFFDLGRIASLGAFFYLVMDMVVHWGVFRYRR